MKRFLLASALMAGSFLAMSTTAFAGTINDAEQDIISIVENQYNYNGYIYRIKDNYQQRVRNYLLQDDVDMSQSEVDDYIGEFYSNFATGIERGYLEVCGTVPGAGGGASQGSGNTPSTGAEQNGSEQNGSEQNGAEGDPAAPAGEPADAAGQAGAQEAPSVVEVPEASVGTAQDNTTGATAKGEVEYTVAPVEPTTMYVWDTETLNVRKEAYQASERVGTLAKGDAVTVIGAATTGWAQIEFEGDVAYVSANYLVTEGYRNKELGITPEAESQATDTETTAETEETSTQAPESETESVLQETITEAAETESQIESETETPTQEKDYSDAEPVGHSVNVAVIAVVIAVIFLLVFGGIVLWHNSKNHKNRKK